MKKKGLPIWFKVTNYSKNTSVGHEDSAIKKSATSLDIVYIISFGCKGNLHTILQNRDTLDHKTKKSNQIKLYGSGVLIHYFG